MRALEYRDKKPMDGETLKWVRIVFCDIFQLKWVNVLTVGMLLLHSLSFSAQVVSLIMSGRNLTASAKYIPTLAFTFYGIAVCLELAFEGRELSLSPKKLKPWATDAATYETEQKIKRESFIFTICAAVLSLEIVITGITLSTTLVMPFDLIDENTLASLIYKLYIILLVAPFSIHLFLTLYVIMQVQFQVYLLQDHVKNLHCVNGEKIFMNAMLQDHCYQKEIRVRLKFCMERYSHIRKVSNDGIARLGIFLFVCAIAAVFHGIGILILITNISLNCGNFCKFFVLSSSFGAFAGFIVVGQKAEDEFENVSQLFLEIPWYLLDRCNRRDFITFMPYNTKPFTFKFLDNVALNYKLGLAIVQHIYAASSVFLQLKTK